MVHPIVSTPTFAFLPNNEKSCALEIIAAIEKEITQPKLRLKETVKGGRKILEIPIRFDFSDPVLCCLTAYYVDILHWRSLDHINSNGCNFILLTE